MAVEEEDYVGEEELLQQLEPEFLDREETSGPEVTGDLPEDLADLLEEQGGGSSVVEDNEGSAVDSEAGGEEDDPGGDEDSEEEGEDGETASAPSIEELRAELESLQKARQEESVFTELGRRMAYHQVQGVSPGGGGGQAKQGVDPEVRQALAVILNPNLTKEEKREELGSFTAKAREEAVAAFRKNQLRLAEIVADPDGYEQKIVSAARQAFDSRLAQIEQRQQLEGMLTRNRITDPKDVQFFLQKLASGVSESDALTLLRAARGGPSLKRKEDRIKAKERDQRAVRRAQRGKGRSKPSKGRRRPGKNDLEKMSPEDLAEFAADYLKSGGDPQDLMPPGY